MARIMHQIHRGKPLIEFETIELAGLVWMLEEKMKEIRKRLEYFQQAPLHHHQCGDRVDDHPEINGGDQGRTTAADESFWWENLHRENSNGCGSGSTARADVEHICVAPQGYYSDVGHGNPYNKVVSAGNNNNGNEQMGLPCGYFGGGINISNLNAGNFDTNNNVLGVPQMMSFGGNDHQVGNIGVQNYGTNGNVNGGNDQMGFGIQGFVNSIGSGNNNGGNDMGIGQIPYSNNGGYNIGGSSVIGSDIGLPSALFGGGSDAGLPFDVSKNWPTSFSP